MQAIKAGLLEIADIFVVNKADKPGAEQVVKQLGLLMSQEHDVAEVGSADTQDCRAHGQGD